jgi:hypothetical protein
MNNEDIDFLVRGIESRIALATEMIPQMESMSDDIKVKHLLDLLGGANGEMTFIREQLLAAKKPIR